MNRFHTPHPDGTSRLSVPLSINNASNLFPFHNLFIQLLSPSDGTRGLCFSLHNASPLFCGNILFLPNIKIGCLSTLSPHNEIALNPPNECNRPEIALNITLRARVFSEIFSFPIPWKPLLEVLKRFNAEWTDPEFSARFAEEDSPKRGNNPN